MNVLAASDKKQKRRRCWPILCGALCLAFAARPAAAAGARLQEGIRAYASGHYDKAAQIFSVLAPKGNPLARAYLGYMYEYGKGVPQDYVVAAGWYKCASQQGVAQAQYELGLMYDRALGVPQDYVKAYALVNLAVAKKPAGIERDRWLNIRDALGTKLSLVELTKAQQMSFEGVPEGPCLPISTGVQIWPPWPVIPP